METNEEIIAQKLDDVNKFIDVVFKHGIEEGHYPLGWSKRAGKGGGLPVDLDDLVDNVKENALTTRAFYYCISSATELRARKKSFSALSVIVLDDIGTKNEKDLKGILLKPTYIIESSEGNFQYGYVLDQPITDYWVAENLTSLVAKSGYGDAGASGVMRQVRLPLGVNGKKGKENFEVRLTELHEDRQYSITEILEAVDADVSLEDIINRSDRIRASRIRMHGASAINGAELTDVRDDVYEWLLENDYVLDVNGDFKQIVCPWHHEHTTGGNEAGYSPLGSGDTPESQHRRGFKCFHGHCAERKTEHFLNWVEMNGGPAATVDKTPEGEMLNNFVYNAEADTVSMLNNEFGFGSAELKVVSAKRMLAPMSPFVKAEGAKKAKRVCLVERAICHKSSIRVAGSRYRPDVQAKIYKDEGAMYLNKATRPAFPRFKVKKEQIKWFNDFLRYLIPDPTARDYYLQWTAAKLNEENFRGCAVLMYTPTQGTGRGLLGKMITGVFGQTNVANADFQDIVNNQFNSHWIENQYVICDEVYSDKNSFKRDYQKMKTLIDPSAAPRMVNEKGRPAYLAKMTASFLLFTNESDCLNLENEDRRMYVLNNTMTRKSPQYFTELHTKVDTTEEWKAELYNYLLDYPYDATMLNAPPPMTDAKRAMKSASAGVVANVTMHLAQVLANKGGLNVTALSHVITEQIAAERALELVMPPAVRTRASQIKKALIPRECKTGDARLAILDSQSKKSRKNCHIGYFKDSDVAKEDVDNYLKELTFREVCDIYKTEVVDYLSREDYI